MPVFNMTIDDISPVIQYAIWWGDSSDADPLKSSYVNSTFHATDIQSASAALTFNGSAVYIFGANRNNHDVYAVNLDGTTVTANGYSPTPLFNQTLFSRTGLDTGISHEVTLKNQFGTSVPSWVDVDYMVVTAGDGNEETSSLDTVFDDDSANIIYSGSWSASSNSSYYMQTVHATNEQGSSASIIFEGNAVSLYGATAVNHGLYSVSMDGQEAVTFNGTAPTFRSQMLLYWASGLPNGQHNVTITNLDTTGLLLDLDKAVNSTWISTGKTVTSVLASIFPTPTQDGESGSTNAQNPGLQSAGTSRSVAIGPIVGGVVGGFALASILAVAVWLLQRRRKVMHVVPSQQVKADLLQRPGPFTVTPFVTSDRALGTYNNGPQRREEFANVPYRSPYAKGPTHPGDESGPSSGLRQPESEYSIPPPDYLQAIAGRSQLRIDIPGEIPAATVQSSTLDSLNTSTTNPASPR